ncbi:hypothetical protein [Maricaulis sp.]|uniref:hypothetical protein n=1 Tax=Maricaulis sp. TaxID=1486257 RepID=UPI0025B94188|nr:hypothetical protein [Maricaulis sp.]
MKLGHVIVGAAALIAGICFAAPAESQTGAATSSVDRRYRGSPTIANVVDSESIANAGCEMWVASWRYLWHLNPVLSHGDMPNMPGQLVGFSYGDGLSLQHADRESTWFGFIDNVRVLNENGCDIRWYRSVYVSDPDANGVSYRYVLNYRADHRVAVRYLRVENGQTEELARAVFERGDIYSPTFVDTLPPRIGEERVESPGAPTGMSTASVLNRTRG